MMFVKIVTSQKPSAIPKLLLKGLGQIKNIKLLDTLDVMH